MHIHVLSFVIKHCSVWNIEKSDMKCNIGQIGITILTDFATAYAVLFLCGYYKSCIYYYKDENVHAISFSELSIRANALDIRIHMSFIVYSTVCLTLRNECII